MTVSSIVRRGRLGLALAGALLLATASQAAPAADHKAAAKGPQTPDPKVMSFLKLDDVKWTADPKHPGLYSHTLMGDPSKPGGQYILLAKWEPGHMSRPHYHLHNRYITVIKGTWWVGWGRHYDPKSTYPMPPGSFVTHFAMQTHYDGAKGEPVILLMSGEGPADTIDNEEK